MAEGSVIIRILKIFMTAFENSAVKRIFNTKESFVISALKKYASKGSVYQYSLSYAVIMKIVSLLDIVAEKICGFFEKLISGSQCMNSLNKMKKIKLSVFALFFSGLALSYTLSSIVIRKDITLAVSSVCVMLLVLSFLETNWKRLSKTSIVCGFLKKLFEA